MDQCLRIALWMVLLIGFLQARTLTKLVSSKEINLRLDALQKEVECGPNVTFTSPTNVQVHCYPAALTTIEKELKSVKENCTGKVRRVDQVLKILGPIPTSFPSINSTDCKWEDVGSQKSFQVFVKNIKNVIEELNSISARPTDITSH